MKAIVLFLFAPLLAKAEELSFSTRENSIIQTALMFAVAGLFFYFILWRPEKKQRVQLQKLRDQLKKGDRVTAMGIIGKVEQVAEQSVILKMVDGSKIEMIKAAISDIEPETNKAVASD